MENRTDRESGITDEAIVKRNSRIVAKSAVIAAFAIIIIYFCVERYDGLAKAIGTITNVLRPFAIGFAMAFIMSPVMNGIEGVLLRIFKKRKDKARTGIRIFSSIIAILFLFLIIVIFLWAVVPQIVETLTYIFSHIEEQIANVVEWADEITGRQFTDVLTDAKQQENIKNALLNGKEWILNYLDWEEQSIMVQQITSGVTAVGRIILQILIGFVAAVYFLIDKEKYKSILKKMVYGVCPTKTANVVMDITRKAGDIFYGFFVGKIIDSAIIGVICYVCMLLFGMPYPVLVSVVVGVTNIIPIFGPYIGAVPTVTIIFFTDPMQGIYFLIFVILLQQLDGNVIGPKILGDSTGVSAFWVLFAIVTGGGLLGFMGMLFGVPFVALIYYILSKLFIYLTGKKGLSTWTMDYENLKEVNLETNEIILNEESKKKRIILFERLRKVKNKK